MHADGSSFERHVWNWLLTIPYGAMTSCGAIASELGLTNGARAVGRANGAKSYPNRHSVPSRHRLRRPTHRVVRRFTAEARALLKLEGAIAPLEPRLF